MKTAMLVFAEVFVMGFDILTVGTTFLWICGLMNLGDAQGWTLIFMWMIGLSISLAVFVAVSEED